MKIQWTKHDENYLRANLNKLGYEAIARKFGVSGSSIRRKAKELGVAFQKPKQQPVLKKKNGVNRPTRMDVLERMTNLKPKKVRDNMEGRIRVRVTDKLEIFVKPGVDIDAIKQKYVNHVGRNFE